MEMFAIVFLFVCASFIQQAYGLFQDHRVSKENNSQPVDNSFNKGLTDLD